MRPGKSGAYGNDTHRRTDTFHELYGKQVAFRRKGRKVRNLKTYQRETEQGAGSQCRTSGGGNGLYGQLQGIRQRRTSPFHSHRKYEA